MSEEEKIGKNLFKYNGIIYTDNIPKNMFISITKEQYIEYMQQKETIEKQQKEIEELKKENFDTVYIQAIENYKTKIREKIKRCKKELEENNENIDYTRKLVYTADETIKKEIQDLEELLEE